MSEFPDLNSGEGPCPNSLLGEKYGCEGKQVSLSDLQVDSDKLVQNHSIPGNTAIESQKICTNNLATPITKLLGIEGNLKPNSGKVLITVAFE